MMGDFSAMIGSNNRGYDYEEIMGRYGLGEMNNGEDPLVIVQYVKFGSHGANGLAV